MAAAASGAQAVLCTEGNMLVQLLESQRFESVNLLAAETEEGQTDISGWVLRNAKMSTLTASGWFDTTTGWLTDAEGGNFRIYAMPSPADADVDRGECPCPNAVERWNGNGHHWPENTNIIYQTANVPNGTYAVTMWAESQALADHTHKGGMFLFANEVQAEITNNCVMQQYALTVEVTDGTLTVGVKTGAGGSDDNHVGSLPWPSWRTMRCWKESAARILLMRQEPWPMLLARKDMAGRKARATLLQVIT